MAAKIIFEDCPLDAVHAPHGYKRGDVAYQCHGRQEGFGRKHATPRWERDDVKVVPPESDCDCA